MEPCDHPKGYYHGNGDSFCPDCEFFFTAGHHISLLMKRVATQQARIEALGGVLREMLELDKAIEETTDIAKEIELEELQAWMYKTAAALLREGE